ncbi:hypothetical protein B0H13DRAFT_2683756 [Mycena leptocephala]|nr:hypothetical protein B0H13DRAFT_2683756 [Mycena leptocephala]
MNLRHLIINAGHGICARSVVFAPSFFILLFLPRRGILHAQDQTRARRASSPSPRVPATLVKIFSCAGGEHPTAGSVDAERGTAGRSRFRAHALGPGLLREVQLRGRMSSRSTHPDIPTRPRFPLLPKNPDTARPGFYASLSRALLFVVGALASREAESAGGRQRRRGRGTRTRARRAFACGRRD